MRVLVACEFSGVVREAFKAKGHDAWSCDLLRSDIPSDHHIIGDIRYVLGPEWDLLIAHPPCTYLTVAANGWHRKFFSIRQPKREEAADFFMYLYNYPIYKVCVENPIGVMSSLFRKPDQIIQPWQYGHDTRKATCLWLKGLPKLVPTNIVSPETVKGTSPKGKKYYSMNWLPQSDERWKIRSRTFQGVADAMAEQWGSE
jgi:hypothetical protein